MRLPTLIAMLTSVLVIPSGNTQDNKPVDLAVLALISAFTNARAHFDAKALNALLTPDYVDSLRGERLAMMIARNCNREQLQLSASA